MNNKHNPHELAAALAAALYLHGTSRPTEIAETAQSMLRNYKYQRDRIARIAAGTATRGDLITYPDDAYVVNDHASVTIRLGARRFELQRDVDETGVSGTGRVAEGVVLPEGLVALHWLTTHRSVCFYSSISDVELIHGHGGKTRVVYPDPPLPDPPMPVDDNAF